MRTYGMSAKNTKERLVFLAWLMTTPEYLQETFGVEDVENVLEALQGPDVDQLMRCVLDSAQHHFAGHPACDWIAQQDGALAEWNVESLKAMALSYWDKMVAKREYEAEKESLLSFDQLNAYFDKRKTNFEKASQLPHDLGGFTLVIPEEELALKTDNSPAWSHKNRRMIVVQNEDNRFAINAGHAAVADTIPVLPVFYKVGYEAGEGAQRAFNQMVAIRTATKTIIIVSESQAQMAKPLRKKFAAHFDQMLPDENGVMPEAPAATKANKEESADDQPAQATLF